MCLPQRVAFFGGGVRGMAPADSVEDIHCHIEG